jgi:hypothetical protein
MPKQATYTGTHIEPTTDASTEVDSGAVNQFVGVPWVAIAGLWFTDCLWAIKSDLTCSTEVYALRG